MYRISKTCAMEIKKQLEATLKASRSLNLLSVEQINRILHDVADAAVAQADPILVENKKDLDRMDATDPRYDRLKLSRERIAGIAGDIRNVSTLPSPLGRILKQTVRPNGMQITKIAVPFGVIGIIYEARPNVTFDVFSLCLKSGNACVLKGGSDADSSNKAIVRVIHAVLEKHGVDRNILALLPPGREATAEILNARGYVDLIIPRGSQGLINYVRENATIPVIETGAGICHTYFDESGDTAKGRAIVNNAKTRRCSVCNALDCLIIHESRLGDLPQICSELPASQVVVYADEKAYAALEGKYPAELLQKATEESFGTEFLDYKMAIKTVASFEEALEHISVYSSKHSEAIITEDESRKDLFRKMVDAAAVYCNVSTAFTDGAQFGLGAEIGISTQKLHARGPMALEELTSHKWLIDGDGQIRAK
ncbi:MAG: glutamate-5-semialdehyde dehydrogenase [Prolixibacteraceae bacterium]